MLTSAYATLMSLDELERQRPFGPRPLPAAARSLGFYRCGDGPLQGHDLATRAEVARQLADVLGYRFSGGVVSAAELPEGAYVVPSDTLTSLEEARRLNIAGPEDLFGGVVPHPFVATKLVTHPLVSRRAAAPAHWVHELGHELAGCVLPGYSVFGRDDDQWGQRVCAAYAGVAEPAAVHVWAAERLAAYKRPKQVEQHPELPHNAAGKIQRLVLAGGQHANP